MPTQKLLYLVSEDWYFVSHRLPMARSAKNAGYEVHVATRVGNCAQQIIREGFNLHPIQWRRGSMNPFRFLRTIMETRRLYRQLRPDLVHHVALVPTVIGSIAALGLPMARLNAFAGLGFIFTSDTTKARLVRWIANPLLGWLLKRPNTSVLVQNPDDRSVAMQLGVPRDRIALIPGSGIDVDNLTPLPEPTGPFTVGFVGRLLDDKGVRTLVRAHEILTEHGLAVRTLLAGAPDPSNPASIPDHVLALWRDHNNLVMLGHVDDVRTVWAQAHVGVLPSRREGLPKSLLEAAACGRPLIATDVPGCREIARHGVNALLVPPDDPQALANAIEILMKDRDLRLSFGRAGRQLVTDEFSSGRIGREIVALYAHLLAATAGLESQSSEGPAS
ncbi:MAG: glycosyltransferase family 4 protein [Rhizobiales bacterium]|nr:glycosyltransferase family 4 protein [Hyphomicrobiales bacterium]